MRLILLAVATIACGDHAVANTPKSTFDLVAVRIDPTTFEEARLGIIRFQANPPFEASLVEGDALKPIIKQMNALDHVMSGGSTPSKVKRDVEEYFRIMRYGWLKDTHAIQLRLANKSTAKRKLDVIAFEDGKADTMLGTVTIDDMGYLAVASDPKAQRARLGAILDDANQRDSESVRAAPPPGERGSWGRVIDRGTAEFATLQRDRLYGDEILLVPSGHARPQKTKIEGEVGSFVESNWISVHVPSRLIVAPDDTVIAQLSGPPGGPLGVRIAKYTKIENTAKALEAHIAKLYGKQPGFVAQRAGEVEVAGRKLLAVAYQSGESLARSANLYIIWPDPNHPNDGVAIQLTTTGSDKPKSAADILAMPELAMAVDSLFIDFEWAP